MKQEWEKINAKLEAMSLRERVFVFFAVVFLIAFLVNYWLLEPLMARQKSTRMQVTQQQEMLNQVQMQIATLVQDNSSNSSSPQQTQIKQLKLEMAEGNAYLQSNRERLVQPEKMAEHLRQLLSRNSRLILVSLQTMPVAPLLEQSEDKSIKKAQVAKVSTVSSMLDKQVFKHGVQLTVRGNYLDLLQYLSALEKLPQQMYWAKAQLIVTQYPASELSLTLYTLSLEKTWLQI